MAALVLKYCSWLVMTSRWTEEERRMLQLRPGKAEMTTAFYPQIKASYDIFLSCSALDLSGPLCEKTLTTISQSRKVSDSIWSEVYNGIQYVSVCSRDMLEVEEDNTIHMGKTSYEADIDLLCSRDAYEWHAVTAMSVLQRNVISKSQSILHRALTYCLHSLHA